jgi:GntR family transcriptional regulator
MDETTPRADRARRIADVLRQQVLAGAYRTLPDERALAADFGASRNAVRDALVLLAGEGLVDRRRGVGTVVVGQRHRHPLSRLTGLAETLTGAVRNEVRVAAPLRAPAAVAARLGTDDTVYLERLRYLDDEPLSLDRTYLAGDVGRPLLGADLAGRDVFALVEETAGVRLGTADLDVRAATADAHTARLLGVPAGAAVFAIERLSRAAGGRPVDLEYLVVRGDRLTLHAALDRR